MSALGSWCDRRGCGGDDKPQKVVMISIAAGRRAYIPISRQHNVRYTGVVTQINAPQENFQQETQIGSKY